MRQRERTNRTFVPLWNVDITSLSVITEWVLMVLLKSLNWIPTHLLLSWLYLNSLQQWSSRHRLPHRIKLTPLMLNSARDEIVVTLVSSLFENNIYRSSQWIWDKNKQSLNRHCGEMACIRTRRVISSHRRQIQEVTH